MNLVLCGHRAVVTGGAQGIGFSIARALADLGANVVILDITDRGEEAAAQLNGNFVQIDVSDVGATREAMATAMDSLGGIDILVNCAGILSHSSILDVTPEQWDHTLDVNARATLITTQAAAARMIEQGQGGRIINIASMAAKSGGRNEAHYAASKAAVVALTRVTALELGEHGITANSLCPGYVLTEMGAATRTDEDVAAWSALSPLGRLGQPEDVAGVAAFLASTAGAYLTGQSINVTGGMIMH